MIKSCYLCSVKVKNDIIINIKNYKMKLTKLQRLEEMFDYLRTKGLVRNKKELSQAINMPSQASLSRAFSGSENYITQSLLTRINSSFGNVFNIEWVNTGEGEMLSVKDNMVVSTIANYRTVPFDNFGKNEVICLGSVFPTASSAVVLNDDAFDIYPKGSILVLKEVKKQNMLWGKDYYIETEDYKFARCIQNDGDYIIGYGYNHTKYPDGSDVYGPIRIAKSDITRLHLIIGVIVRN